MKLIRHTCFLLALLALSGCETDPVFPLEPNISFVSITPSTATQFTADEIKVTIHYEDGDGDLGYNGDPVNNLFLTDLRLAFAGNPGRVNSFSFESLSPNTKNPSIQGDITITLTTPPYEPSEEALVFEIYLIDRAGNESNRITTDGITILQ
jgi:hypothetical protein